MTPHSLPIPHPHPGQSPSPPTVTKAALGGPLASAHPRRIEGLLLGIAAGDAAGWPSGRHRAARMPDWTRRLTRELDTFADPTAERLWTSATVITFVRTIIAVVLAAYAAHEYLTGEDIRPTNKSLAR